MANNNKKGITIIGGIFDKKTEKEFFNFELDNSKKYLQGSFLIVPIIYLLMGIANYYILGNKEAFEIILFIKLGIFLLSLATIILISKIKDYNKLKYWFTFYEIVFCVSYLGISYLGGFSDYFIHCFEVIVILIGIFIIPNRWINSLLVSLVFVASYFGFSYFMISDIEPSHFIATIIYVSINLLFIAIFTFRIYSYKRYQYLYEKRLSQVSLMDQLSEISNRFKFDEEYRRLFNHYKNHKGKLALVLFEIDNFKRINKELGREVGDEVLREIVRMVKVFIRGNDVFARWGEEEFIILLSGVDTSQAISVTKRIKEGIWEHYFSGVGTVTCCFGVASPTENEGMDDLLVRVDNYLQKAKNEGKNEIIFK